MNRKVEVKREKGYVLITLVLSVAALVAFAGIAVDIGRIYIARNEAQTFADSSSLAATLELDGTFEGLNRARSQASINPNRWNFMGDAFTTYETSFAKDRIGPWETNPVDARGYRFARVSATVPVPLTFLQIFTNKASEGTPMAFLISGGATLNVRGDSAAGQEPKTRFREGLFPFSPFAHSLQEPHYGLVPGVRYTLRWAATPRLNGNNICPGDDVASIIDLAQAGGGEERGFIEETSADVIRASIEEDYQTIFRAVGDAVDMTGGAKQTQLASLLNRVHQDTDSTSLTYAQYLEGRRGNGRRVIGAPINTGYPNYRIVQIGAFLLLPSSEYDSGGNRAFCAEYLGAWVQGSRNKGVEPSGAHVARLVK